jgi:hypothetical protein
LSDCVDLSHFETYDVKVKSAIPLLANQPPVRGDGGAVGWPADDDWHRRVGAR